MVDMSTLASEEFLAIIQWHKAGLAVFTVKQLSVFIAIIVCEAIKSLMLMSCS